MEVAGIAQHQVASAGAQATAASSSHSLRQQSRPGALALVETGVSDTIGVFAGDEGTPSPGKKQKVEGGANSGAIMEDEDCIVLKVVGAASNSAEVPASAMTDSNVELSAAVSNTDSAVVVCPICNCELGQISNEMMNVHVDRCLGS